MCKVLFVSSGNSKAGISPIVTSQGESLKFFGINLEYYTIKGKGINGYLKNILLLRKFLRNNHYDIIHAHYSLSAVVASLSCRLPIITSLMGSDTHMNLFWKSMIKFLYRFRWNATIVKSVRMKKNNALKKAIVIPNGVSKKLFKPMEKNIAGMKVGFSIKKKYVSFIANPKRAEKNFSLAKEAFQLLDNESVELNLIYNVDQNLIPDYINGSDIILLTSLWEGSPNIIKEAMACNCPVVSTDVGDVKWLFGDTPGYYLTSFEPSDVAKKILKALNFSKNAEKTRGRERLVELGLDDDTISKKIIKIYQSVLKQ